MTGPEHYREGERLLINGRIDEARAHFEAAQVAVTAMAFVDVMPTADAAEWTLTVSSDAPAAITPEDDKQDGSVTR